MYRQQNNRNPHRNPRSPSKQPQNNEARRPTILGANTTPTKPQQPNIPSKPSFNRPKQHASPRKANIHKKIKMPTSVTEKVYTLVNEQGALVYDVKQVS